MRRSARCRTTRNCSAPPATRCWAGSCGGCEIALLEIKEKIVEVDAAYDVVFWPAAADFKYKDLEAYDDDFIDVCLFNGCIRNSENEHIAKVLRDKSKLLVAFGAVILSRGMLFAGM